MPEQIPIISILAGCLDDVVDELKPDTVAVLGVPYGENSSFMREPALSPLRIRQVLHAGSANLCLLTALGTR